MEQAVTRANDILNRSRPDIVGLAMFAEEEDRHLTPFFVGRETEMGRIERCVTRVVRRRNAGERKPAVGATVLIAGVPGAGKTALMDKLAKDWSDTSEGARAPLAIEVRLSLLGKPEELAAYVCEQFAGRGCGASGAILTGFAASASASSEAGSASWWRRRRSRGRRRRDA